MEALLFNISAVYLKWRPPSMKAHNGLLKTYHIIVRGHDYSLNISKILTNVSIDAVSPTLLIANLTEGVTYTVSVAAGNNAGIGPFSKPATLRLDPVTKKLDQSSTRYAISHDHMDDFLTQPWFILILGTILAVIMLSFGAMVFLKRKHMMMKQAALGGIGDPRINSMLKFSSIPRAADTYWLDSSVWRQNQSKENIPDYAAVCNAPTLPVDTNTNRPRFMNTDYSQYQPSDYAEVSSFHKSPSECSGSQSPHPYATTTLLSNSRITNFRFNNSPNMYYTNELYPNGRMGAPATNGEGDNYSRNVYSESYYNPQEKISITENKLAGRFYNNNNHHQQQLQPSSVSVPHTPIGTIRRSRLKFGRPAHHNSHQPHNFHTSFGDGVNDGSQPQQHYQNNGEANGPNQQEQLYIKIGETTRNGSMNWSHLNRNLYQNHESLGGSSAGGGGAGAKDIIYAPAGNRSLLSYTSGGSVKDGGGGHADNV